MSTVQEIQDAIRQLPADDSAALRAWFIERDAGVAPSAPADPSAPKSDPFSRLKTFVAGGNAGVPRDRVVVPRAVRIGGILAVLSLLIGLLSPLWNDALRQIVARVMIVLWGVGPPLWFWFEWSFLTDSFTKTELESLKHSHDLSRNVWIAIVAVIAFLFGLKPL